MTTITSNDQISALFTSGRRFTSGVVRIIVKKTDDQRDPLGRVAFIAGKKLGNAVVRNKSKRILRAAVQQLSHSCDGYDILFLATPLTAGSPSYDVLHALERLLIKAGVFNG